jgi:hypothetical protein
MGLCFGYLLLESGLGGLARGGREDADALHRLLELTQLSVYGSQTFLL